MLLFLSVFFLVFVCIDLFCSMFFSAFFANKVFLNNNLVVLRSFGNLSLTPFCLTLAVGFQVLSG